MFNDHHSGLAPYRSPQQPPMQSDTLKSAKLQIGTKLFVVSLKENIRGQCLVITEIHGDRKNAIVLPVSGLADFARAFAEMAQAEAEFAAKTDRQD